MSQAYAIIPAERLLVSFGFLLACFSLSSMTPLFRLQARLLDLTSAGSPTSPLYALYLPPARSFKV